MSLHLEVVKKHWPLFTGGALGLLVLYYILKHGSGGGHGSAATTGSADAVQAYSAAADLQNSNANAAITIASIQGSVATQQIAAHLKETEVTTAAQLAATQQDTSAKEIVALSSTEAAVRTAAIQSDTIKSVVKNTNDSRVAIARIQTAPVMTALSNINSQIFAMFKGSKHFSSDIAAVSPVFALELGQGGAGASIAQSNAQVKTSGDAKTASIVKSGLSFLGGLLG